MDFVVRPPNLLVYCDHGSGGSIQQAVRTIPGYVAKSSTVQDVDALLRVRDILNLELLHQLQQAHERMKKQANNHRHEKSFEVGNWMLLKLQPYRQGSVEIRQSQKFSKRFYRPYKVVARVGVVAYQLELPPGSAIHPVFHVSVLKELKGDTPTQILEELSLTPSFSPIPARIIDNRVLKTVNDAKGHCKGESD
ncbi:uncharacterized protein LOC107628092 [Arachis ipaensis]|uniref:uncharacterized protein LOC107628092 n=1 Tax=Arachis ipaensis TaxID=130454 RepID=UPI0007AFBA64|nr:uncharacterized protein LOC107628092 [Arachis ipaensis]